MPSASSSSMSRFGPCSPRWTPSWSRPDRGTGARAGGMARNRRRAETPAPRLILDSGAVIAWSRGDVRARALLTRALELGRDIRIPVAVLAETLRGGPRDAPVHRVRNAVDVVPTEEATARLAGALLAQTGGRTRWTPSSRPKR
jgi:hypothetical protein